MFSNDDALVAALKHHDIDAIEDVPATAIKTLRSSGFTIKQVPGLDHTDFIINSNPKKTKHRELLDPRVKTAMDYAIDRAQIVRVVFLGAAHPGDSIIPPSSGAWYNPAVKPTPFNLAKANSILDGLGYKKGSDGIRVANGSKMSYDGDHADRRAQHPAHVPDHPGGVPEDRHPADAEVARLERGVRRDHRAERQVHRLRPLDVGLGRRCVDPDFMLSVVTCEQYGGWSDSGYCDKNYDAMYSQAAADAEPDEAARDRLADAGVPAADEAVPLAREPRQRERLRLELDGHRHVAAGAVQLALEGQPDEHPPEVDGGPCAAPTTSSSARRSRVVTVFVAVTLNFALFRLAPGIARSPNLSRVPHATPELRHALKKQFGLDKSKGEQYVIYLKQLAHGNLGVSFANEQPVSTNLRVGAHQHAADGAARARCSRSSSGRSPA